MLITILAIIAALFVGAAIGALFMAWFVLGHRSDERRIVGGYQPTVSCDPRPPQGTNPPKGTA